MQCECEWLALPFASILAFRIFPHILT